MPWLVGIFFMALVGVGTFAWSYVDTYQRNLVELTQCRHSAMLFKQREESYKLRIERRDDAINASQCKATINHWVRNPDEIPQPFNPFNQLNGGRG